MQYHTNDNYNLLNMELSEEKRNLNLSIWIKKLKNYGCYSDSLIDKYGDKIKNATFNINEANGACYDGSLIDTVLNTLCVIGYHINEYGFGKNENDKLRHPFLCVNNDMLMRVLLLQHIGKADMFIPQTENWKKNNGMLYDFNGELDTQLKLGERSVFMCMNNGINLSEQEFEAIMSIDKDEKKNNSHQNVLYTVVKFVNSLTSIELQRRHDYYETEKPIKIEK